MLRSVDASQSSCCACCVSNFVFEHLVCFFACFFLPFFRGCLAYKFHPLCYSRTLFDFDSGSGIVSAEVWQKVCAKAGPPPSLPPFPTPPLRVQIFPESRAASKIAEDKSQLKQEWKEHHFALHVYRKTGTQSSSDDRLPMLRSILLS